MFKLIKTEFKKIFKIKMNIILIIIAMIGTMSFAVLKYMEYDNSQYYNGGLANLEGEKISGIEVCQNEDRIMHQYAGEYNQEKYNQLNQEYKSLIQKYSQGQLDDSLMKQYYGDHYMELIKHIDNGTLTKQIIDDYCQKYNVNITVGEYMDSLKDGKLFLPLYTQNEGTLNLIKQTFVGIGFDKSSHTLSLFENNEDYKNLLNVMLSHRIKSPEGFERENLNWRGLNEEDIKTYENYLNTQAENLPTHFDSALPNEMLNLTLSSTIWIGMLSIMIILANTFGMEKQYNMEQMIYSTKSGKFKITIAKTITTILFSIMMMSLILLSCWLVSLIILPIHSIDMAILSDSGALLAFTWRYYFMYMILLVIFAGVATGLLTSLISYITKNRFTTIIIMMLFTVAGFPISQSGKLPDIVLSILPYNMAIYGGYFVSPQFQFPYAFINDHIVVLRDVALIVWGVLFVMMSGSLILHSRKHYIER